ncbi:Facilitated trehalose transporter Tret1, partial [Pseudolycoriella hygida]
MERRESLSKCSIGSTQEISNLRTALPQFLAVGVKNVLLYGYGMTLGFPTIVIPAIQGGDGHYDEHPHDIRLNKEEISWFSSINLLCVPLGCIFSGMLTQPIGKRMAMQIVNIPIFLAWLLFHFSTNIYHLYAGLCLAGLSGGLMEAPVLTYVAEVTQPKFRGMLAATGSTCVILGVFTQFLLGTFLKWRTIAAISAVFPLLSITALFFVPESPHWLLLKNRVEDARKSLAWLRGWVPVDRIEDELKTIQTVLKKLPSDGTSVNSSVSSKKCSTVTPYTKKSFLVPYALVAFTFFIGHFSGKTPLQTYAVQIFHTLKAPIDKYYATVLLGAVEIAGTVFCVVLIHYTGKRKLVLMSTIGVGLGFCGAATYAKFLHSVPGVSVDNVVANVSSLDINKANYITVMNVPQILEDSLLENYKNESVRNETVEDYEDQVHVMKVRAIMETIDDLKREEYMIPLTLYDDFNSTNFDFELMSSDIDGTDSPFNLTVESDNRTVEATSPANEKKNLLDQLVIPIPKAEENKYLWLPLTLLLMSAFFAHMGIKLIPWMLIGEVFPASVRSGASGISGGTGYAFGFLANKLFLKMLATLTLPGTFYFYSGVAFVGTIVLYFVLPETEGRSLIEIEQHFSGGAKLNEKPGPSNEVTKGSAGSATSPVRPKTDVVIGIPISDQVETHKEKNHKADVEHVDLKNWESDRI